MQYTLVDVDYEIKILKEHGVIDIVRTQLWGEGGSAKCVQMRARGGEGYWL